MKVRIASAGTGKTTSLVLRYLELLATYPPQRIGVVTYTRLATAELRERIRDALEQLARGETYFGYEAPKGLRTNAERYAQQVLEAPIRTIHGFFADLLRLAAPHLSLDPEFAVLDPGGATALFHESAQTVAFLQGLERAPIAEAEYLFARRPLAPELVPSGERSEELHRFYQAALEEYLRRTAGRQLGPADIELLALRLTSLPEDLLRRIAARYPVVLVDEAQDTSPLQSEVIATLERMGVQVEIVGDPKQSIYGFRDADPEGFRRAAETGEVLPPLTTSRRHSAALTRFLNTLTQRLTELDDPPFLPEEAPPVSTARADVAGSTSLLVIRGLNFEKLDELRRAEANALAARIKELMENGGYRWSDVFVLTRSHAPTSLLAQTFQRWGIPHVVIGSRGLYALPEIRDLYHALAAALSPRKKRDSLAAFLTGPFAALDNATATHVLASDDPLARLEGLAPDVHERLMRIREWTTLSPEDSLVRLTREPMLEGRSYYDLLDPTQREHVDYVIARLRTAQTYQQVLYLLETLKAYDTEEGSFPTGAGDAVEIMTVHGAKGREAPIVAIFNAGAPSRHRSQPLYVEPFTGRYAVKGDSDYDELKHRQAERERHEEDRLLYVATSRARDHLLVTASLNWPEGKDPYRWQGSWAHTLMVRLGSPAEIFDSLETLTPDKAPSPPELEKRGEPREHSLEPDPRLLEPIPLGPWPVYSPSALKSERQEVADEEEAVPQDPEVSLFARIAGILTHAGIALSWHPDHVDIAELLQGEEVTHELPPERHPELVERVAENLRAYWKLIEEGKIPAPEARDEDYAEYPLVFPLGGTVWEGVIDRVYRVGDRWFLEDYKTDAEIHPERYFAQLALYREALRKAWGIEPEVRLVYLQKPQVVFLREKQLSAGIKALSAAHTKQGQ